MAKVPEYEFLEHLCGVNENCPIKIKSGDYKDIVFKYGQISIKETINEQIEVNMEIEMVEAPKEFDKNNNNFTNIVGEIFVHIIENDVAIKKEQKQVIDLEDDVHQD